VEGVRGARLEKLLWRLNRLRCMTPAEVGHRVVRLARAQAERLGASGAVPEADLSAAPEPWIRAPSIADAGPVLAAAARVASGRLDVFSLHDADLGDPPRWNRDPKTGIEAPLAFGKLLDYRNERLVGDIKYLWEPNRHLQLVTLAQAYALSGEFRWFAALRDQLESWFAACPDGRGPNWSSALEAAIRLINWSIAWQLLGGARSRLFEGAGADFRRRWLDSVYRHARFVAGNFSLYSSANNHLLGEASGLFVAALTWPHWRRARGWAAAAKAILEREALLQNAPDGVNREQAVSYQQFSLDFLVLPLLAGRPAGIAFPRAYEARIEAMLEYLASIMDAGGNVPMIGDADDGYVVKLSQAPGFCPYRSLLATGAVLFGRPEFKAKARTLDDKTRWLLGEDAERRFAGIAAVPPGTAARLPVRAEFPEGGYWILGSEFETKDEIRLVVDCGPLGYTSIAAHGHADALAFTLSLGGLEFLVDPGTYAYHTQAQWRQYFRGTSAHNTVVVDGVSQSRPGGNFMWLAKARATCDSWGTLPGRDIFEGRHDGYLRLPDPVVHRRRIVLEKHARRIVVDDTLEARAGHRVEAFFHCAEACAVEPVPGGFAVRRDGRTVTLLFPGAGVSDTRLLRASVAPFGGWVSRRFDEKVPATTIVRHAVTAGTATLRTLILA
jgi:heparinase II/III-like protein